ncbi:MAG: UbiA family prenyltransferase, partial [Desulfohalobiaceae bacterium]|nr:UbiA family prenyltransferase [Desulfohalobiaceae bacterium]
MSLSGSVASSAARPAGRLQAVSRSVRIFFRMVKIEHSVFALPFALAGLFLAAGGWPGWWTLVFLVLAMVAVRSFAMAMNRILDRNIDARNPRT